VELVDSVPQQKNCTDLFVIIHVGDQQFQQAVTRSVLATSKGRTAKDEVTSCLVETDVSAVDNYTVIELHDSSYSQQLIAAANKSTLSVKVSQPPLLFCRNRAITAQLYVIASCATSPLY
jgi:hypothetical protein